MVIVDSVTNYQYSQYSDRDVKKKGDPYRSVPVKGTNQIQNPPQFRLLGQEKSHFKVVRRTTIEKAKKKKGEAMENIYRELTGKGLTIDEKV